MLELVGINYWAVLVVWLINVVVGAFWYSPAGFGKQWEKYTGVDMMKIPEKKATRIIMFVALSAAIQAMTLAIVINSLESVDAYNGFIIGLTISLGLICASTVGVTLYSLRSWKFWWINSSYFLLVMTVNSVILSIWH